MKFNGLITLIQLTLKLIPNNLGVNVVSVHLKFLVMAVNVHLLRSLIQSTRDVKKVWKTYVLDGGTKKPMVVLLNPMLTAILIIVECASKLLGEKKTCQLNTETTVCVVIKAGEMKILADIVLKTTNTMMTIMVQTDLT